MANINDVRQVYVWTGSRGRHVDFRQLSGHCKWEQHRRIDDINMQVIKTSALPPTSMPLTSIQTTACTMKRTTNTTALRPQSNKKKMLLLIKQTCNWTASTPDCSSCQRYATAHLIILVIPWASSSSPSAFWKSSGLQRAAWQQQVDCQVMHSPASDSCCLPQLCCICHLQAHSREKTISLCTDAETHTHTHTHTQEHKGRC